MLPRPSSEILIWFIGNGPAPLPGYMYLTSQAMITCQQHGENCRDAALLERQRCTRECRGPVNLNISTGQVRCA